MPTEYVDILDWSAGFEGDQKAAEDYCQAAADWLTEHEGDDLSITIRMPRRGEVTGLRVVDARGELRTTHGDYSDEVERVRSLIEQTWQLWCERLIG